MIPHNTLVVAAAAAVAVLVDGGVGGQDVLACIVRILSVIICILNDLISSKFSCIFIVLPILLRVLQHSRQKFGMKSST